MNRRRPSLTLALLLLVPPACVPPVVERDLDGVPVSRGHLRRGRADGRTTLFGPDGRRLAVGKFADGVPVGLWHWCGPDGIRRERTQLRDGVPDGPSATWHGNGRTESRGTYRAGRREGAWWFWLADGTLDAARTGYYVGGVRLE